MGIESSTWPWLRHLTDMDVSEFFQDLQSATMKEDLEEIAEAVDQLVTEWRVTAEALADPEAREALLNSTLADFGPVPEPEVPQPVQRHYYSYSHQRWDGKHFLNICKDCDRSKDHPVHLWAPGLQDSWPGAKYESGQVFRLPGADRLWIVTKVTVNGYILRHFHHKPGEAWFTYYSNRATIEDAAEPVEVEHPDEL